ncbi:mavicyanin [Medicago truncatula]|nr:mavicyanin [Medicago truncatula]
MLIISTPLLSAHKFKVGGKDGWTVKASGHYEVWASRIKFLVSDTLNFKYNKLVDSLLMVNKQAYDSCNVTNPIRKMHGGDSTFLLDKPGHFYFISGNVKHCVKGEKLSLVVLSHQEHHGPSLSPVPANAPTSGVHDGIALVSSGHHMVAPAPHHDHSGFTRLSGSFVVCVVLALILDSFVF